MAILIPVLAAFAAGLWAHSLAVRKQRSVKPWVISSALFVLPVFLLWFLPANDSDQVFSN